MDTTDAVVIGAGIVGLAVARALARAGHDVVVVETEGQIGTHTSSRNSEVIHAGIYYPKDSLRALFCVRGKEMLYRYCEERNVAHRRCGKLIVAASASELAELESIWQRAAANGVDDLRVLEAREAQRLEPELSCAGALLSPSTGIIDSHAYMLALQGDAEDAGAVVAFHTPFEHASIEQDGFVVRTGGEAPFALKTRFLVNAAGLWAPALAHRVEGFDPKSIPKAYYARGNYFSLSGKAPFSRLVYPVPEPGGLGVHLTIDLGGQARFGPDVEWIDGVSYSVDPARCRSFYAAIRRYWPALRDDALMPAYAGVRPKISGPGEPAADFRLSGPREHGVRGLVNLFGIESPGMTSSLPLAEEVVALLSAS
jgi:L-2-hydroxyglutarate oxidase LhgO